MTRPRFAVSCMDVTLAGRVRYWRAQRGLSRSKVALRAGVSDGWLSHIEGGRILKPDPRKLDALARVLGTTVQDLYAAAGYVQVEPMPDELRDVVVLLAGLPAKERTKVLKMIMVLLEYEPPEPTLKRPHWVT